MKKLLTIAIVVAASISAFAGETVTIYTYESLGWLSKTAIPAFEKMHNCKVKLVTFTDAGNIAARLKLEKKSPKADCVVGLTPALVAMSKSEGLLQQYKSDKLSMIEDKSLIFDAEYAVPFDYGALAFVYNPAKLKEIPSTFEDLTKLPKGLIIQDPRTSSTGQDFLLWTIAVKGKDWKNYWARLKPSILTVTPGWSESFAKFEAGEAPIMLSYATDGAYAWENYKSLTYKAFIPNDGGYVQIESSCIVKGAGHAEKAKAFADFMLSPNVQNQIPLNQWMFPVTKVKLPDSFKYAQKLKKTESLEPKDIADNLARYLKEWAEIMK